jgi:hypothetical protein
MKFDGIIFCIFVIIRGIFNDALNVSDYVESNGTMETKS